MIPTTEIKTIPASKAHSLQKRVILYCKDVGMHKDLSELSVEFFCSESRRKRTFRMESDPADCQ